MIEIISVRYNLNMTDIDRRPDKKGLSIFYIDIEGHKSDENVSAYIKDIQLALSDTEVITLGSYPYQPFNEPLIKSIGIIGGTGEMGSRDMGPHPRPGPASLRNNAQGKSLYS